MAAYSTGIAQCCGGCNPIGGNTNQGTLPKYMLQINTYEKYGYSAGYMQNDHASDFQFVKNANSNFAGLSLGYGPVSYTHLTLPTICSG